MIKQQAVKKVTENRADETNKKRIGNTYNVVCIVWMYTCKYTIKYVI